MNGAKKQINANEVAARNKTRRGPNKAPTYTVNGPMNIRAMLKALLIHEPSSKPNPRLPLRSARPSEIMRPVRVTTPAPMMTPRIPSKGLFEISLGIAAAVACAIRMGGTAMVDEAIVYPINAVYGQ